MLKMIEDYTMSLFLINRRILQINAFLKQETNSKKHDDLLVRKAILRIESKELASAVDTMKKYLMCGDADIKTD